MMDLTQKGLPQTLIIGGEPYHINTDYRTWLHFCQDFELWDKKTDLDISYLFSGIIPVIRNREDFDAVLSFAYPASVVPKDTGSSDIRILDYKADAEYIYSAFLGQYGIDLIETDMHWHKFRALLKGINSSTRLYEIMGHRCYEGKDREMIKLRNAWELPADTTEEDKQAIEDFDNYFG